VVDVGSLTPTVDSIPARMIDYPSVQVLSSALTPLPSPLCCLRMDRSIVTSSTVTAYRLHADARVTCLLAVRRSPACETHARLAHICISPSF